MKSKSIAARAFSALLLMVGFYLLAIAISVLLLYIPYAEVVYAERINVRITFFCLAGGLIILWSILPRFDKFVPPGPRLTSQKHPELFRELQEIAGKTGQAMPKEVYLVQDVNAWVSERGGIMGIGRRRIMGLGLPLMQVLSVSQLRAVIAHEFGHYYGGDTKLAPLVFRTRAAIMRTLKGLSGHSSFLQKPFVWYGNLFLRVSHAVSRAQEFTADRLSATINGPEHMINGLCITHSAGLAYNSYWKNEVVPLLGAGFKPPITDGFQRFMEAAPIVKAVEQLIQKELDNTEPNPYSTHPPLKDRIQNVKGIRGMTDNENDNKAITLVQEVDVLEKQLLAMLAGREKVDALKPISWTETGEKAYIPFWEAAIAEQVIALEGVKTDDLPSLSKNLQPFIKKLKKGYDTSVSGEATAVNTIGAALAFTLYKKGWTVESLPGENVVLFKGSLRQEPFSILQRLDSGDLTAEQWEQICRETDITGIDLGRIAVGGFQRDEQLSGKSCSKLPM